MTAQIKTLSSYRISSSRVDLDLGDDSITVELDSTPVGDLQYARVGNTLVLGYLENDEAADNPLENIGQGAIYSSHRHGNTHAEMQEALGLDNQWEKMSPKVQQRSAEMYLDALMAVPSFVKSFYTKKQITKSEVRDVLWSQYLDPVKSYRWLDEDFPNVPAAAQVDIDALHAQMLSTGEIGNPFRVKLDVYQHSGTSYSVSGEGMNCRFDTARGGAVWVPDSYAARALWEAALAPLGVTFATADAVYAWVEDANGHYPGPNGTKQSYVLQKPGFVTLCIDGVTSVHATHEAAVEAAKAALGDRFVPEQAFAVAQPLARERARSACEVYSAWVNGECYGTVIKTMTLSGEAGELDATEDDCNTCSGYIGSDASRTLVQEMEALINKLESKEVA
ncbi:hypothetical protein F6X40_09735 [Paraburkholderia sp. UCT31]|uniref:hypothetical protein n=1 Tax=Paraburkholderia sp. UCT31 TaxID=2615209 RepID=UPI0016565321|nr:hypothetical protein [Paraburkholderia sp. UCT31]MBC8737088.1 hypothetical protein [Paraburkholderia sp. UCT31]